jgi:predicted permease
MIFAASAGGQALGLLCIFTFAIIGLFWAGGAFARRFLKNNDEAREAAKKIARAAADKWLK